MGLNMVLRETLLALYHYVTLRQIDSTFLKATLPSIVLSNFSCFLFVHVESWYSMMSVQNSVEMTCFHNICHWYIRIYCHPREGQTTYIILYSISILFERHIALVLSILKTDACTFHQGRASSIM